MNTNILSIATASPDRYIDGPKSYEYFKNNWALNHKQDQLYKKVLTSGQVQGRHIGVEHDKMPQLLDQDQLIENFRIQASRLTFEASTDVLNLSEIAPAEIKALVVNTCTGYLCPGLSSYLLEDLQLSPSTKVFDLMGMGCGAAIPNLECASALANQYNGYVLSVAVEVCSAAIFDSDDPGCIISNCIFADGAAAAIVSPDGQQSRRLFKVLDFHTGIFPQYRDYLKFVSDNGMLRNVLSMKVPFLAAKAIKQVTAELLAKNGLDFDDIDHWAIHPGGTAVLEQVQKHLNLKDNDIKYSQEIFKKYGNMSSPSVMFVLKNILENKDVQKDQLCCALAFGAGFSAHTALLKFV